MNILIAGGTGQIGHILKRAFQEAGHRVQILTRQDSIDPLFVKWDGRTQGSWTKAIDEADVVINMAGRSVNCRYTKDNMDEMLGSRVDSTQVIGDAIAASKNPPKVWLQMSTATIYAHSFDRDNDEFTGQIGGHETGIPGYWGFSVKIAQAWEQTLNKSKTPHTRKVVLRTAMVMSHDEGGVFDVLMGLVRWRLGGIIGTGRQYISWIHEDDFVAAIKFLIAREELKGVFNLSSPHPLPQKEFMQTLRKAANVRLGIPATTWMSEIGAFFMRTDTELLLKSRRVVPKKLLDHGFQFRFPRWELAAPDLVQAFKSRNVSMAREPELSA